MSKANKTPHASPPGGRSPAVTAAIIGFVGTILTTIITIVAPKIIERIEGTPTSTPTTQIVVVTSTPEQYIDTPTPSPQIIDFMACVEPCNGSNATSTFQEATTEIYLHWDFSHIPKDSHYVRQWTNDERLWIQYDCFWQGPESGSADLSLREPAGLHSGYWEITITVDEVVLLHEKILVEGDWDYWSPVGIRYTCYDS